MSILISFLAASVISTLLEDAKIVSSEDSQVYALLKGLGLGALAAMSLKEIVEILVEFGVHNL